MNKISLMKPELANLIAAGEVIERPSSVIKELVENSIDANAKNIYVGVIDAGKTTIIVKDDGDGMSEADASLCFLRHASSKIKNEFDLMRIHTLGFRGEAIPSIASVSNVTLTTCDGNKKGTRVISKPNQELIVASAPSIKGTIFEVNNLFLNVPARLKYLKSDKVENYAIIDIVEKLALGFPNISFTLVIDGKTIFKTTGKGDIIETVQLIYGQNISSNLYYFETDKTTFNIKGYISKPEINYSKKNYMNLFLNNRFIYANKIIKSISAGYRDYLPPEKYPFALIFLEIDPAAVDVNVHPSKKEVRMSLEDDISYAIEKEIYNTLSNNKPIYDVKGDLKTQKKDIYKDAFGLENIQNEMQINEEINKKEKSEQINLSFPTSFDNKNINKPIIEQKPINKDKESYYSYDNVFSNKTINPSFPKLFPIGQVLQTYIVCDSEDGFYLIDQHAAAERINFEKTEILFANEKSRIVPLFPIIVTLSYKELLNYDQEHLEKLNSLGFIVEKFGEKDIKVSEIPSFLLFDENGITEDVIHSCFNDQKISTLDLLHLTIANIACKKSIKANHIMSASEIDGLLKDLAKCQNPANCPHGRPTMLKLTKNDIEKIFRRTGF